MATSQSMNVASPGKYHQNDCDLSASECPKCVLILKRLHSALEEIESSKLIIELLQQENTDNLNETNGTSKTTYPPNSSSTQMNSKRPEHDKWIVSTTKCHKKYSPFQNSTESNNTYTLPIANRYEPLNLQNTEEQTVQGRVNTANSSRQTRLQLQHKDRIKQVAKENGDNFQTYAIPTLLNGKVENKNLKVRLREENHKDSIKGKKPAQHKVVMIGDSFLRCIRENVDLSLSNTYSTYSMVKPGCELNTLLESANNTMGVLTQKDAIVICGGSNDLNQNKIKSAISSIRKFIERHSHTNIIIANVPIRYDLSYHSLTNAGIRSYNAELKELASEHRHITIIESEFKRKFHTRHGLHFNKQGKLLFSKKNGPGNTHYVR